MDALPFAKPTRLVDDKALKAYRCAHLTCELEGCFRMSCPIPHHIRSRAQGRDDSEANLISLCRPHHLEFHRIGGRKWFWLHRNELLDEARAKVATALRIDEAAA